MSGKDSGTLAVNWGPNEQQVWRRIGDFKSVWLKGEVQRVPTALDAGVSPELDVHFYSTSSSVTSSNWCTILLLWSFQVLIGPSRY